MKSECTVISDDIVRYGNPFILQVSKEAFYWTIIPAVFPTTHALSDPIPPQ